MRKRLEIVVLLSLVTGDAGAAAAVGQEGRQTPQKTQYVVKREAAPAYLFADGKGMARLLINASTGAPDVAVSILTLAPGTAVAEHAHAGSSETLYVERGSVEVTVGGKTLRAASGDTVYLPAGVPHSAKVLGHLDPLRAVQVYVGPGPEQRFANGKKIAPEG